MMKVKCIKTIQPHWGISFEKDKFYEISEIKDVEYEMISDVDKYFDVVRKISSGLKEIRSILDLGDSEKLREFKEKESLYLEDSRRYILKAELTRYSIISEFGKPENFCSVSRSQLMDKYGTSNFILSVSMLEDYFETMDSVRDKKIDKLLS